MRDFSDLYLYGCYLSLFFWWTGSYNLSCIISKWKPFIATSVLPKNYDPRQSWYHKQDDTPRYRNSYKRELKSAIAAMDHCNWMKAKCYKIDHHGEIIPKGSAKIQNLNQPRNPPCGDFSQNESFQFYSPKMRVRFDSLLFISIGQASIRIIRSIVTSFESR